MDWESARESVLKPKSEHKKKQAQLNQQQQQ
jgi:hypothetical protein